MVATEMDGRERESVLSTLRQRGLIIGMRRLILAAPDCASAIKGSVQHKVLIDRMCVNLHKLRRAGQDPICH